MKHMNLVLLSILISWLATNQRLILTYSVFSLPISSCVFFDEQRRLVSSAYIQYLRNWDELHSLFMKMRKRRGPKNLPWGTPRCVESTDEQISPMFYSSHFDCRIVNKKITQKIWPMYKVKRNSLMQEYTSFDRFWNEFSVEKPRRKPNWWGVNMLFSLN